MEFFWAFAMVAVTGIVVFLTSYFVMKNYTEKELHKKRFEVKMKNQKVITPIRLQAYERITLFLERTDPGSIIRRIITQKMTAQQLHSEMLKLIRAEFEHNLSQQIYISQPAWEVVKSAKENIIKIINTSADAVEKNGTAMELSKIILQRITEAGKSPSQIAVEYLKKEVGQYF